MRVLTFLHSFAPGGVERVALRLNRAWLRHGVDAVVVMGRSDGAMIDQAAGIPFRSLSSGRFSTASWETLWMIIMLPRVIRALRPDVLFCAGNSYSVVAVAMKIILGRRCPPVVAKISNDLARFDMPPPVRWGYRKWCRIQAHFIDHFVGMAAPMRAEIANAMAVDDARMTIIHDPAIGLADIGPAKRPASADQGRHYLAAGRLAPQKNFALLIDAFARMARDDDRLAILGEGGDRPALERQIGRLGLSRQVAMPGFVDSLMPHLQSADVFVLSSDFEGVPAVIVEALASGIAIVATDCSVSMADMLGGGALGTLVRPRDCEALAHAMSDVQAGCVSERQAQAARFTIECAALAYVDLFEAVGPGSGQ